MVGAGADDLADLLDDGHWYLSGRVRCQATGTMEFGLATLREVSLTRRPANLCTTPVHWSSTSIVTDGGGQPHGLPLSWRAAWDRAHRQLSGSAYRRAADHLTIDDADELTASEQVFSDPVAARARERADAVALLKAAPPLVTKPVVTKVKPRTRTRADAASEAADLGAEGYSYLGDDGERRYVRHGGRVTGFA